MKIELSKCCGEEKKKINGDCHEDFFCWCCSRCGKHFIPAEAPMVESKPDCIPNCDYKNYVRKGRANLRCKDCDRDLTLELVLMAQCVEDTKVEEKKEKLSDCCNAKFVLVPDKIQVKCTKCGMCYPQNPIHNCRLLNCNVQHSIPSKDEKIQSGDESTVTWQEEYCEKFGLCDEEMACQCKEELKFIKKLLATQKQKYISLGDKMTKVERWTENACPMVDEKAISYNQAIKDYQTKIQDGE